MGLREKIEELIEMSVDDISPENTLLELGMDSIKLVELAGLIEENTDVVICPQKNHWHSGTNNTRFLKHETTVNNSFEKN